ncbi:MAG TPA: tetratricopeptide repeat protein [Myxococcota bacterium]|nr:tetratricopeptide repeat protein [Myxococcota bacterium]
MRGLRVLILVLVALLYLRVMQAPFVYDDKIEVVGNPTIRVLTNWQAVATYNFSRPLLIATYALNWWWSGLESWSYHLVSLGIHLLNTMLALSLGRRLMPPASAMVATLAWAVHPMLIESVTYITGRSDALCATFWLLALIGWADHVRGQSGRIVAMLALAGGLMTKEVAVALPLALMALEQHLRGSIRWRDHRWIWGLGATALVVRLAAYGLPRGEVDRGFFLQAGTQAEVWLRSLQLWLLPVGQSILHDHPAVLGPETLGALLVWAGLGALAWRRGGLAALGLALWVLPLLPASAVPLKETMAEHRSYLSGLGLIWALCSLLPPWDPKKPAWILSLLLLPLLAGATLLRNEVWRDEVTLWQDAADKNPESVDAAYGAADALRLAQRWSAAQAGFERVIAMKEDHLDARINLGITLAEQGKVAEAEQAWLAALRLQPRSCAAHNNLGALARRQGKPRLAITSYQSSMTWCPDDPIAQLALGDLFYEEGDPQKARYHYRRYLAVDPDGPAVKRVQNRLRLLDL